MITANNAVWKEWVRHTEEIRAEAAEMSKDELIEKISDDLFVDAYADQEKAHIAYKGKALAEGLETGLWICPECGTKDITSKFCSNCGTKKPGEGWTCPNCGKKNIKSKFCPKCGRKKDA